MISDKSREMIFSLNDHVMVLDHSLQRRERPIFGHHYSYWSYGVDFLKDW
jgi:hypothetical protein